MLSGPFSSAEDNILGMNAAQGDPYIPKAIQKFRECRRITAEPRDNHSRYGCDRGDRGEYGCDTRAIMYSAVYYLLQHFLYERCPLLVTRSGQMAMIPSASAFCQTPAASVQGAEDRLGVFESRNPNLLYAASFGVSKRFASTWIL